MTSKEMKLIKFKTIIGDAASKISASGLGMSRYSCNPLKLLFGGDIKDEYAIIAINHSFDNLWIDSDDVKFNDIESLISICKQSKRTLISDHIIFFGLIVISIDCDAYDEKLSILTDFAYIIGFDEKRMNDFVNTVKSILCAKKVDLSKLQSQRAINFFTSLVY